MYPWHMPPGPLCTGSVDPVSDELCRDTRLAYGGLPEPWRRHVCSAIALVGEQAGRSEFFGRMRRADACDCGVRQRLLPLSGGSAATVAAPEPSTDGCVECNIGRLRCPLLPPLLSLHP